MPKENLQDLYEIHALQIAGSLHIWTFRNLQDDSRITVSVPYTDDTRTAWDTLEQRLELINQSGATKEQRAAYQALDTTYQSIGIMIGDNLYMRRLGCPNFRVRIAPDGSHEECNVPHTAENNGRVFW